MFSFLKNSTLSRSELNYESGKFKYIHYGDILTKFGDITDTRNFSVPFVTTPEKVIRLEKYFLQNGDVVIADTAEDSMVGKVTEIQNPDPFPTVSGLHTIPIRPNKEFAAGFLGHYMNAPFYHDQLFKLMQGVKVLSLSKSAVIQTKINSPSYCEQRLISRMINLIDGTITLHEEKKRQLERLKSALLQKMFADKSGYPAIRFEGFDKAWEERKLKELGDIQTGNTPPTSDSDNYSLDGVLWVTPTDIKSLVISNTAKKLSQVGVTKARIAKAGSILVTSIASIGKNTLLRMDAGFNQQINSLTPTSENDSYFLLTQSEKWSEKMKQIAASATMQIVNKTEFSNISTYVPVHKEEQEKIGSFFKHLDDTIALHQQKINNINSVKKSLLQKMFI
ncbi:restriction endonuclease subunit S [Lactobacillus delbrueckii]|uniref:restriction endonuclease subunit S n=1 Tax=Lactobacillus delbrueckii TaxID=1584 RepID=UPI0022648789|nr:restriction endonuclease subunit S [Lactobacillus delbrueckii]